MSRVLFFRSDDAGLSPGTNAAIDAAGVVCPNIGLMAVAPAIEDAAARFRVREELCLGLHFTLNSEWPEIPWGPRAPRESVAGLVSPDGVFFPNPWRLPEGVVYDPSEVARELRAQLDFLHSLGLCIRYLDSHMGVLASTPELAALAEDFAAGEGLVCRDRLPKLQHGPCGPNLGADLERWAGLLDGVREPTVAVFHPMRADGVVDRLAPRTADGARPFVARSAEAALLCSPAFRALLKEKAVVVARMDDDR
ncbi:MAG: ChbG/HpnK family deacetylase [Verrucomicrobiota bacterium]